MAIERWTDKKLDKLAQTVSRLATQVELLQQQVSQIGAGVAQSNDRIDLLIQTLQGQIDPASLQPTSAPTPAVEADRFQALETQIQQLNYRIQVLERRGWSQVAAVELSAAIEDDEIEDEPDEILWDFMGSGSDSNR